jgi:hypothetical protein
MDFLCNGEALKVFRIYRCHPVFTVSQYLTNGFDIKEYTISYAKIYTKKNFSIDIRPLRSYLAFENEERVNHCEYVFRYLLDRFDFYFVPLTNPDG